MTTAQNDMFGHVAPDDVDDNTTASDTWLTPRWLLDALGSVDLDPCSDPSRHTPAARHLVGIEGDDGLAEPWRGRVFCNPPYSRGSLPIWAAKCVDSLPRCDWIVLLIPAAVGTKYWHDLIWTQASMVGFPRGRLDFGGNDSPSFDSAAVLFGNHPAFVSKTMQRIRWIRP